METFVEHEIDRNKWKKIDQKEIERRAWQHQQDIIMLGSLFCGSDAALAKNLNIKPPQLARYKKTREMPVSKVHYIEEVLAITIIEEAKRSKISLENAILKRSQKNLSEEDIKKFISVLDLKLRVQGEH